MTDLLPDTVGLIRARLQVPDGSVRGVGETLARFGSFLAEVALAERSTPAGHDKFSAREPVTARSVRYSNPLEVIFGAAAATGGIYKLLVLMRDWNAEKGIKLADRDGADIQNLQLLAELESDFPEVIAARARLDEINQSIVDRLREPGNGLLHDMLTNATRSKDLREVAMSIEDVEPVTEAEAEA